MVELSPFEFLDRLVDTGPQPRQHRHPYLGVFAPNHPLRPFVAALAVGNFGEQRNAATSGHAEAGHDSSPRAAGNPSRTSKPPTPPTRRSLASLTVALPAGIRTQRINRGFFPNFLFGPHDLAVTLGQDGLVVNVARYLTGQPLVAFNPDPERIDGVLVPCAVAMATATLKATLAGTLPVRRVTLARVTLDDGQVIDAVNDLLVGVQSRASARYRLEGRNRREEQSSSGVIISTGAGSTGWCRSVVTAAAGMAAALGAGREAAGIADRYRFDAETRELRFSVREPFTSQSSQATIVSGPIAAGESLDIISQMPRGGVIFSDGMEQDFIRFDAGMRARITVADDRQLALVSPAPRGGPD